MTSLASPKEISTQFDFIKKIALANNEFAFKLHKLFNLRENCLTSPASVFTALMLLYQGAKGVTAEELHRILLFTVSRLNDENINHHFQELLSFLGNSSHRCNLDIANGIMVNYKYPVLKEYKDTLKYYDVMIKEVNFATTKECTEAIEVINDWISTRTQGEVPNLLESLDVDTGLILLNAVCFKGTWKTKFSPRTTSVETFYNEGVDEVSVQMMRANDKFLYGYFPQHDVQALSLPYQDDVISMVLLLPLKRKGMIKLEQELTPSKLQDIISKMGKETVIISVPKFRFEDKKELQYNLSSLGMETAFTNGADFCGISMQGNLKVSKIVHKAVIEVNEEGIEEGTFLSVCHSSCTRVMYFEVDHPFLFFIRDERSGMILFYGRVNKL